ncbi:hypothetical protein O181_130463 [Austropuccinia psidii MF-1]|uniref:Uncharacterized protein n=1 Tax=Austropuccinia psidii MF-1 TaxID=1389203 RepID=A0A9Q3Q9U0_9BASI|nr:hypothetical protein [Austropuccinia psidii MF-1]
MPSTRSGASYNPSSSSQKVHRRDYGSSQPGTEGKGSVDDFQTTKIGVTTMEINSLGLQYGISMPRPIYGNLAISINHWPNWPSHLIWPFMAISSSGPNLGPSPSSGLSWPFSTFVQFWYFQVNRGNTAQEAVFGFKYSFCAFAHFCTFCAFAHFCALCANTVLRLYELYLAKYLKRQSDTSEAFQNQISPISSWRHL